MSTLHPCDTIRCQRCDGSGHLEETEAACPVCDGDPLITFAVVEEYARQIDANRKRILMLEGLCWTYYALHQHREDALCNCRLCVTTRKILHLAVEDDRTPAQRKMDALDTLAEMKVGE